MGPPSTQQKRKGKLNAGAWSEQVPRAFLDLVTTLASRSREAHVRIGRNTQDYATLSNSLSQGNAIQNLSVDPNDPTATPTLLFARDLLYMMNNIFNLVPVKWHLPFPTYFAPRNLESATGRGPCHLPALSFIL